jgi:thymidine phosphorylase
VLGAGRTRSDQPVHPGVGLEIHKKVGERVERGEPLVTLRVAEQGVDQAIELVHGAYSISG